MLVYRADGNTYAGFAKFDPKHNADCVYVRVGGTHDLWSVEGPYGLRALQIYYFGVRDLEDLDYVLFRRIPATRVTVTWRNSRGKQLQTIESFVYREDAERFAAQKRELESTISVEIT